MIMKKQFAISIFFSILIMVMPSSNVFALICANGSGNGYDPIAARSVGGPTIEDYVVQGAGYYLNAYSDILVFLNRVELSEKNGMDQVEWEQVLNRAITNMNGALESYDQLIKTAELTPYNPTAVMMLQNFDYPGYRSTHGLNSAIFTEVQTYLKTGDITGTYKKIAADFLIINQILQTIKTSVNANQMPELHTLWRLNEVCSKTLRFGQYIAHVFKAMAE